MIWILKYCIEYIISYGHETICSNSVYFTGPIPKKIVDFWRLIWQEKPTTVVMVTNLIEKNKSKCEQYWPETGNIDYGPFKVTITESQNFADYCIRILQVSVSIII